MADQFRVDVSSDWHTFEPRWLKLAHTAPTPFQSPAVMRLWYSVFGQSPDFEPLLVAVVDASSGEDLLLLPLVRQRCGSPRTIAFADAWVIDSSAPLVSPRLALDVSTASRLWMSIRGALPPTDVIHLAKMLPHRETRPNPLSLLPRITASPFTRYVLQLQGPWTDQLRRFDRHTRKEFGRSLRLFEAAGEASIRLAETSQDAQHIVRAIDGFQQLRLQSGNINHIFEDAKPRQFYAQLTATVSSPSAAEGRALVSALELDGQIVAGILAIVAGKTMTLLRIGNKGGELARIGLGRLAIERTIAAVSALGIRTIDFSIGEGSVKRLFKADAEQLVDLRLPLTWRGRASLAAATARSSLIQSPLGDFARRSRRWLQRTSVSP